MIVIQELFEAMQNLVGLFGDLIKNTFQTVVSIFYEGEALTTMGYILLIGVVVGLFWFVLSWLRRLITLRNRG